MSHGWQNPIVEDVDRKLAYDQQTTRDAAMHNRGTSGASYADLTDCGTFARTTAPRQAMLAMRDPRPHLSASTSAKARIPVVFLYNPW
jgi:hypothetical protein